MIRVCKIMTVEEAIITQPHHEDQVPQLDKEKESPDNNKKRNRMILWLTFLILGAALIWLLLYLLYFQYHESTDDAYVNGNLININSVISGTVTAFYADNTDLVNEGQLLVKLDPTELLVKYNQALASLASTTLQVRQIYDQVKVSHANLESKTTALSRAKYDYGNRATLIGTESISQEDYIHSKDEVALAQAAFKEAESQLARALDAAGNTPLEHHPLLEQAKATVREAYYRLNHCNIYAPARGYIAQRTVNVGQHVTPQTPLMAIIPIDYVWVDANFKETQLTYMRVGQPATVWFDIYGSGVKYQGKVLGIASGSGSVFSLIPPQNATGNWIKIVQRIPVRISLDPKQLEKYPARLGISAEVNVDLSNQNLPMLTAEKAIHAVAETNVFDLSFHEVNQKIEEVIHQNLEEVKD